MSEITVFTFSGDWGLPSTGPFALKLLKWLDIAGLGYRHVIQENPAKGPKGKNPWIELDGKRIGDSEIIISLLASKTGFNIDGSLSNVERAKTHAVRRMLEEHLHQVLEWELFMHPAGAVQVRKIAGTIAPAFLAGTAQSMISRHFRKQLYARGIARHSEAEIIQKGIADIEAFETILGDRTFLGGAQPCMADVSAYGLLAPLARWPMSTPVANNIKSRPTLMSYLDRMAGIKSQSKRTTFSTPQSLDESSTIQNSPIKSRSTTPDRTSQLNSDFWWPCW